MTKVGFLTAILNGSLKVCNGNGSPIAQWAKTVKGAGKIMHLIFFDKCDAIYDQIVPSGTGDHCSSPPYCPDFARCDFLVSWSQNRIEKVKDWSRIELNNGVKQTIKNGFSKVYDKWIKQWDKFIGDFLNTCFIVIL